jgi:endoglucanase
MLRVKCVTLIIQVLFNQIGHKMRICPVTILVLFFCGQPKAEQLGTEVSQVNKCSYAGIGELSGRLRALRRGFSISGWLDTLEGSAPKAELLANLREKGFTHVRIPIRLELISPAFSDAAVILATQKKIANAARLMTRLGYAVIMDMHPGKLFRKIHQERPNEALDVLKSSWEKVVESVRGTDYNNLILELLNEPSVSEDVWSSQLVDVAGFVRKLAPFHTLIAGPALFQRYEALERLKPLADRNVIYAFHFYDPMVFTHQSQTWTEGPLKYISSVQFPNDLQGVTPAIDRLVASGRYSSASMLKQEFSEPWTQERLYRSIARVSNWSREKGVPVAMNEFGVLSFGAPRGARLTWLRGVRQAAEQVCIPWTVWEMRGGFGFVSGTLNSFSIDEQLISALLD